MWLCAVPDDTPMTPQSQVPSAGPYYVTSSSHDQLVLARNPNYGGHRPRIPKQIVYTFPATLPTAVQEVQSGRSDYVNSENFGENPAAALEARYGPNSPAARTGHQRYFINPAMDVDYFVFNTRRPLFASARVRRAVNYAIDRRALVEQHFSFIGGLATDHYLPPGVPGSLPVDIYPLGGPDLAKARSLARAVHPPATMLHVRGGPVLHRVRQARQGQPRGDRHHTPHPPPPRRRAGSDAWRGQASRGTSPSRTMEPTFPTPPTSSTTCSTPPRPINLGRFNDPAFTRRMRQAATLSGARRLRAAFHLNEDLSQKRPSSRGMG